MNLSAIQSNNIIATQQITQGNVSPELQAAFNAVLNDLKNPNITPAQFAADVSNLDQLAQQQDPSLLQELQGAPYLQGFSLAQCSNPDAAAAYLYCFESGSEGEKLGIIGQISVMLPSSSQS
jgi:hypothetical protein